MSPTPSDGDSLRVSLPDDVPNAFLLFCRLPPRQVPTPESLHSLIKEWVAQNVNAPLRDLILPWLDLPVMTLRVDETRSLPSEMVRGLQDWVSDDVFAQIRQATHCIVARSPDALLFPRVGLWASLASGMACAQRFGGVLIDADTSRDFPANIAFPELHTAGMFHIRHFLLVPMSQDEQGLYWMTTRGMSRFGLPEVQVEDIPLIDLKQLVFVVCGVCQSLAARVMRQAQEAGELQSSLDLPSKMRLPWPDVQMARGLPPEDSPPPGCTGEAYLRLTLQAAKRAPAQTFLTLNPPESEADDKGAWLHRLVHAFFPPEDTLRRAPLDTDAMEQAHQQALTSLPEIKRRFQIGGLGKSRLAAKHGFPVDGGHEFMWVLVASWAGDRLEGQLVNTPQQRRDLREGQTVSLNEAGIYDWMIFHADGSREGGATDIVATAPDAETRGGKPDEAEIKRRFRQYLDSVPQAQAAPKRGWTPWPVALARTLLGSKPASLTPEQRDPVQTQLAEQGRLVIAFIAMANSSLMSPGQGDAPCLALFVFEEQEGDANFLIALVDRLMALKGTAPSEPEEREAAVLVNDEAYVPYRRRRIPLGLTGGRTVYAVDLRIRRDRLPNGCLEMPILPCLAMPGDSGAIEMLPWQILPQQFLSAEQA